MTQPLRIGIAGLGTVGGGTLKILKEQAELIAARTGRVISVTAVCARDKSKKRNADIGGLRWLEDPLALARDAEVDVVVETIGGADGIARQLVEAALAQGKSVVTANKALIAHHGVQLAALAEKHNAMLAFEAAVAGGIPIIKALQSGLAANRFGRIVGILNGTCNYILTSMWEEKKSFDAALKEAQAEGYAEADPSFDIDGVDTAHKLAILASLAYGTAPAIGQVHVEGIRQMTLRDMEFAHELGYTVKLLGIASPSDSGVMQRVHPCLVPRSSPLAAVRGATNAVMVDGDAVGTMQFEGPGAGAGPTASSVVADIMDIARGSHYAPFTLPTSKLQTLPPIDMSALSTCYYLRLSVIDKPGVLSEVTGLFKAEEISLRSFLQHSHDPGEAVQVVLTTHATRESSMRRAMERLAGLGAVREKPYMIRIENV